MSSESLALATINVQEGLPVDDFTFKTTTGLIFDPERIHNKDNSTGLYVPDFWNLAMSSVRYGEDLIEPEDGLSLFKVPWKLLEAVDLQNFADHEQNSGDKFELDEDSTNAAIELVADQLGDDYQLDPTGVMLRSLPSIGLSSRGTTNGMHFDDGDPRKLRIGVNIGDIPRYVYYVPVPKDEILGELGCQDEIVDATVYEEIAGLGLPVISAKVNPGEGWTLPTVDYLHDGRRAVPDGFSSFVLLSATQSAAE